MIRSVPLELRGERVNLLPQRAVWWPATRTLIVSDLHLGKEHAYASVGVGLPGTVLAESLGRLASIIDAHHAERVLVVGDMLHSRAGITEDVLEQVAAWRAEHPVTIDLVPGNHDRVAEEACARWRIRMLDDEVIEAPFRFTHEPDGGAEGSFTWAGHLHPGVRVSGSGDRLLLPCFVIGERVGVLPAFSRFTGRSDAACQLPGERWAIADGLIFAADTLTPRR